MEHLTIKNDLLNKLTNDLYFSEIELERLVNIDTISYSDQLNLIEKTLENIVFIKTKISAINTYLKIEE